MRNVFGRLIMLSALCLGAAIAACSSNVSAVNGALPAGNTAPQPTPLPAGNAAAQPTPLPDNRNKLLIIADSMKNEVIALPPYPGSSASPVWIAHVVVAGTTYFPLNAARDNAGRLFVTMRTFPGIAIFDNPSSSPASADAVLAGPHTDLVDPIGIALDAAGKIFVVDQRGQRIVVFPSGARGDASPLAVISGPHTEVSSPLDVALDASGDIFVADLANGILEFPPAATGDVPPVRTISVRGSETTDVALDRKGDIYASVLNFNSPRINEYAPGASGVATPIRELGGSATEIKHPWALAICSDDTLYVTDGEISPTSLRKILLFAPGWAVGTHETAPRSVIEGGPSQVTAPFGLQFY